MENSIITYKSTSQLNELGLNGDSVRSFRFNNYEADKEISVKFHFSDLTSLTSALKLQRQWAMVQEESMLLAIENLMKKNHFLQLTLQLLEQLMTEEEFEHEITQNPDKYIINTNDITDPLVLNVISYILNKINKKLTLDEVSEMFSIDPDSLNEHVNLLETDN